VTQTNNTENTYGVLGKGCTKHLEKTQSDAEVSRTTLERMIRSPSTQKNDRAASPESVWSRIIMKRD
jgi:hypothetical protein